MAASAIIFAIVKAAFEARISVKAIFVLIALTNLAFSDFCVYRTSVYSLSQHN